MTVEWYKDYYAGAHGMAGKSSSQIRAYEPCSREQGRVWAALKRE